MVGDGHQPNRRGLIPNIKIPIEGGMTIPNIRSLDPSTHGFQLSSSTRWHVVQQEYTRAAADSVYPIFTFISSTNVP